MVLYGLIFIYFSNTIEILAIPVILTFFLFISFFTCCHLFGYNPLMINAILNRVDKGSAKSPLICPNCGLMTIQNDITCPRCGASLKSSLERWGD